MACKPETPVIIVLGVYVDNYVKLCEKTVLSCPENVMKSFTVLSSVAEVVVLILSTAGLRSAGLCLALPGSIGTPGPPCLL